VQLEGLGKRNLMAIGNRTRELPMCSVVHQPTTLPRSPVRLEDRDFLTGLHVCNAGEGVIINVCKIQIWEGVLCLMLRRSQYLNMTSNGKMINE
jgi:hypothetical protein